MENYIRLGKEDNICTALRVLSKGEALNNITISDGMPNGHKFAIRDIKLGKLGERVFKYGYAIERCKAALVNIGTFTDTVEGLRFWKKSGLDFLQHSSNLNLFLNSAKIIEGEVNSGS